MAVHLTLLNTQPAYTGTGVYISPVCPTQHIQDGVLLELDQMESSVEAYSCMR